MPELLTDHEWQAGTRLRVVVEAAEWQVRAAIENVLQRAGYATASCPGPEGSGHRCPVTTGDSCSMVEQADLVIHALRLTDRRNLEALRTIRRRWPRLPVVVEVPVPVVDQRAADLEGCTVVHPPMNTGALLSAVERALASRRR